MKSTDAIVIENNPHIVTNLINDIEGVISYATDVVTAFLKLKIGDYPYSHIQVTDAKSMVESILLESNKDFKVAGMNIKKHKLAEMLELPSGVGALQQAIDTLVKYIENIHHTEHGMNGIHILSLVKVENSVAKICETKLAAFKRRYTIILNTPKEIALFNTYSKFCEALNEFMQAHKFNQIIDLSLKFSDVQGLKRNFTGTKFEPDAHYIKQWANR